MVGDKLTIQAVNSYFVSVLVKKKMVISNIDIIFPILASIS